MFEYTPNVDKMFEKIKSEMIKQVSEETKETIERLTKENIALIEDNTELAKKAKTVAAANEDFFLTSQLIDTLKSRLDSAADKDEEERLLYNFLDCFFEKDFVENIYRVPLWLGCAVQYYSNRDIIFKILKMLDIDFPEELEGVKPFRLPQDWSEEELDAVFANMGNHVNCNCCYFKDNLQFWVNKALKDPIEVCKCSFTEIPWQFLLRNPLLKKEKYLKEIGRMFCVPNGKYHAYQWLHFAYITKYQELTPEEIKIIIDNIDYASYNNKNDGLRNFLLNNIKLIDNEDFLSILYQYNKNSYDFKYHCTVLEMPRRFVKQYMRDTHDIEWLKKNKDQFTEEQLTELTLAALGVDEK